MALNTGFLARQKFAAHEQIPPDNVLETKTAGPTGHEGVGSLFDKGLRLGWNRTSGSDGDGGDSERVCCSDIIAHGYGTGHRARYVHAPHREAAEYIRQEVVRCPSGTSPECHGVLDLYRGAAGQRYAICRVHAGRVALTGRIDDLQGV